MTSVHTYNIELNNNLADNLEFNGGLMLKQVGTLTDGTKYYNVEGEFISSVISIGDNFKAFDSVLLVGDTIDVITNIRTSVNGSDWSEWVSVDTAVPSPLIQVKLILKAKVTDVIYKELDFLTSDETARLTYSEFVEYIGGLRLKSNYKYDMTLDTTWNGTGSLHRKKITRDDWVRIDRLQVVK